MQKKFIAAISDTDILIHLTKAGHLNLLGQVFESIYIPEYVYSRELKRKAGPLFYDIEKIISDVNSIFTVVKDTDLDLIEKQIKKLAITTIGELVGRGEAECAALSKAKDIQMIISDNSSEFKYLSEFLMLTYYDVLVLCVHLEVMKFEEAEAIYNAVNDVLEHKSSHSFKAKYNKSMAWITNCGWDEFLT